MLLFGKYGLGGSEELQAMEKFEFREHSSVSPKGYGIITLPQLSVQLDLAMEMEELVFERAEPSTADKTSSSSTRKLILFWNDNK